MSVRTARNRHQTRDTHILWRLGGLEARRLGGLEVLEARKSLWGSRAFVVCLDVLVSYSYVFRLAQGVWGSVVGWVVCWVWDGGIGWMVCVWSVCCDLRCVVGLSKDRGLCTCVWSDRHIGLPVGTIRRGRGRMSAVTCVCSQLVAAESPRTYWFRM